ncbi:transposase [Fictibacillus sp. NRS-1165]|uniref:transposase n=1 Tax=Fictibacillus sp. NRS-1165 TaxID=3144463 RepID=UPI003D227D57
MVCKINVKDNVRKFSIPHRDSAEWNQLYKERNSVERCFSRLKTNMTANNLHVRGREKVKTHVLLNAIVLLASVLGCIVQKTLRRLLKS